MTKLFLKLWILILLTSFCSYHIQSYVFAWSAERMATNNSNERFRRTYVLIEEVLAPFPKSEWPARFEKMKARVGSPDVFLGPSQLLMVQDLASAAKLSPEAIAIIRKEDPYSRDTPDGNGYEIFHTILGTDYVVVLKAPFARRGPPTLVFGVLTSTQFTWLVESSMYALAILLWLSLFRRDMIKLERAATRVGVVARMLKCVADEVTW